MKPEEALKVVGDWVSIETSKRRYEKCEVIELSDALITLKTALEKQVPKKPIRCGENPDGTYQFKCSECGRLWWEEGYITRYCDNCGNPVERGKL